MFLPQGVLKYGAIRTEFVDLEKFLDSMCQDLFTGFCEFKTDEKHVVWLFETGKIQRIFCLEKGETRLLFPDKALDECQILSGEVRGVVLPQEIVDVMVRLLFCNPFHQNLSTQFIDFRNLLRNLEEDAFTGYVEIRIGEDVHYLHLVKGGPREASYSSGNQFVQGAEALENIFENVEFEHASLTVYELQEVPLAETFLTLSKGLLTTYSELKGPLMTKNLWKKLSTCAEPFSEVQGGNLEFTLEDLPSDFRKQEKVFVSLLECQIEVLKDELGEEPTHNLYVTMVENLESPMKELFGRIV